MNDAKNENVLIRSVRSKRAFRIIYLPIYICSVVLSVGLAAWMAYLVYRSGEGVLSEMVDQAFAASFMFSLFCIMGPLAILAQVLIRDRLNRASITVTERRLKCTCGKKTRLDIPLSQVKRLSVDSEMLESVQFYYAGKKRTVWFVENCQEIYETIVAQQKKMLADEDGEA